MAFVAKREGDRPMPASRWVHVLSLELGWMTPGEAKGFVRRAMDAGVLEGDDELGHVGGAVEIPRGWKPDPSAAPEAVADDEGFLAWAKEVAAHTGQDLGQVLQAVAEVQEQHLLDALAAVLYVAADAGLDVRRAAREAFTRRTATGSAR